jgi:DNA-3-methyladenine glycosylase
VSFRLERQFFERPVNDVARDLIGCRLGFNGVGGVIVETEAYDATDPACHAYNGMTARNAPLFGPPGVAYVYFSYGMHHLLNFVCEPEGSAAAVLVRAIEPTDGVEQMRARRRVKIEGELCSGPGKLTQALGVGPEHNTTSLLGSPFALLGRDSDWREVKVETDLRIGITKGVDLPWRYCAAESPFLSVPLSARAEN